jgi:hypothetical protein
MPFKITVEETRLVTRPMPREWVKLRDDSDERGYAPQVNYQKVEQTEIYSQVVESLDMKALVSTINQITRAE